MGQAGGVIRTLEGHDPQHFFSSLSQGHETTVDRIP